MGLPDAWTGLAVVLRKQRRRHSENDSRILFLCSPKNKNANTSPYKKKTLVGNAAHVQLINHGKIYCLGYSYLRNTLHGESKSLGGF